MTPSAELSSLLLSEAHRINSPQFIKDDPVQFPRRFPALRDREIAGLLTAQISWGKRAMILRNADRLLNLMDSLPYQFMMEREYEHIDPEMNIHRTFFGRHLIYMLRGLREIYTRHDTLDDFCRYIKAADSELPAWKLVEAMQEMFRRGNNGLSCPRALPNNLRTSALKRVNMWLRWMVRDDGIVDPGGWKSLTPARLFIPLDVHVGNTARSLRLIARKANDRKTAVELTDVLREISPEDPVLLDYALFGLGVEGALRHIASKTY